MSEANKFVVTEVPHLLKLLSDAQVEFIVIGGVAAIMHGSARLTLDLDIVYRRSSDNMERLVGALTPFEPYLRGAPPGLPFKWDAKTLARGLNFTLRTRLGDIDLLGEVAGGGTYEDLWPQSALMDAFGARYYCVDLERLIQIKRAAGRPKDLQAIAELEAILEERGEAGQ